MKWLTAVLLSLAAVLAGLLLYRSVAPRPLAGGTSLDTPIKVPALALTDEQGRATTLAASEGGRMRLIFFGYVHCPDVCPVTLSSLKNTYAALSADQQKRLQVQFVTVDPSNDTPRLMREYLGKFDPAFTGLTGTADHINAAARALAVLNVAPSALSMNHAGHMDHAAGDSAQDSSTQDSSAHDTDADHVSAAEAGRIHGDEVRVVTPSGEFVRVYTNQEAVDGTLQRDLPGLLRQYAD